MPPTICSDADPTDLGLPGPRSRHRVVVAMSGGVDSSVTAALLHEAGYEVVGITLQLYDHGVAIGRKGACCAGQDIADARTVAESLGFPHYVLDYESRFRQAVIEDFADSYLRGETPIPCVRCNQTVKFADLLRTARELDASCLATGHYVRRDPGPPARLLKGLDAAKDQSYFLFATTPEQLDYLRFPLGGMSKAETRAHAQRFGLAIADKPDSQDICFVPQGRYQDVVRRIRPEADRPGPITDLSGREIGRHGGIAGFTIGQRRGLNLDPALEAAHGPLHVVRIDPAQARLVVGPRAALARDLVFIGAMNWLTNPAERAAAEGREGLAVSARLRNTMAPVSGRLFARDEGRALLKLDRPELGVSAGQAAVFYAEDLLLGGGWITGADLSTPLPAVAEALAG